MTPVSVLRRDGARAARRRRTAAVRALRVPSGRACAWMTSARTTRTGSPTTRPATRCAQLRVGEEASAVAALRCVGWSSSICASPLECCGFGGTFAVKNADVSTAMLSDKLRDVLDSRAEVVCAVDFVVPDAHRRRAHTWADRRSHRSPRGDPGLDRGHMRRRGSSSVEAGLLHEVNGANAGPPTCEPAADVHQARRMDRTHHLRASCRGRHAACPKTSAGATSAFLTAKVPPNPQHSSGSREIDELHPTHRAQQL